MMKQCEIIFSRRFVVPPLSGLLRCLQSSPMFRCFLPSYCLLLLFASAAWLTEATARDTRGTQFIGFTRFNSFQTARGSEPTELVLISPIILPDTKFDELVASWNADAPPGTWLRVEVRAFRFKRPTTFYTMGLWSTDTSRFPRESVLNQKDEHGDVATDTLRLQDPADSFQVRVFLGGENVTRPELKFLGLSLTDTRAKPLPLSTLTKTWGKVLPVPERSQMVYPNGKVICSPTTVSMLMGYWAAKLNRPELDRAVPDIVEAVYDTNWKGTGNWVFNMAYAGSFPGMRAYAARLTDLSQLEQWIAAGIPVGLSLCYDRLRGKGPGPNGHLVVCVGFTPEGDVVVNDPGTTENVQKVFPRKNLADAWAYSRNTAYLVYPETASVPSDRFGHWHSWSSTRRIGYDR
jgi:hypothetical protein